MRRGESAERGSDEREGAGDDLALNADDIQKELHEEVADEVRPQLLVER